LRGKQDSFSRFRCKNAAKTVFLPHLAAFDLDHMSILSAKVEGTYQFKKMKGALRVVILPNADDE